MQISSLMMYLSRRDIGFEISVGPNIKYESNDRYERIYKAAGP